MGHVQKGNLKSYWSIDYLLHTPIFDQIMFRDRYIQILHYLYFHDNEDDSEIVDHPLVKIKPVIDLQSKFSVTLIPGKSVRR